MSILKLVYSMQPNDAQVPSSLCHQAISRHIDNLTKQFVVFLIGVWYHSADEIQMDRYSPTP